MNDKNQAARVKRIVRLKTKYEGVDFELFRQQVLEEAVAMNDLSSSPSYIEQHLYHLSITGLGAFCIIALILTK